MQSYNKNYIESKPEMIKVRIKREPKLKIYWFWIFLGLILITLLFLSGCSKQEVGTLYLGENQSFILKEYDNNNIQYNLIETNNKGSYVEYMGDEYTIHEYMNINHKKDINIYLIIGVIILFIIFILWFSFKSYNNQFDSYEDD
jgi:hypothetical protein